MKAKSANLYQQVLMGAETAAKSLQGVLSLDVGCVTVV